MATAPTRTAAAPPPIGGNCNIRGATRRRHADSQLLMLQNPHRHQCRARCRGRGPGWGAGGCRKPGNCTHGRRHGETNFAQQEPRRAASVQNSPSTSRTAPLPVQNSPCSPEMARLALFLHAGRVLYRSHHQEAEQGEFCTEREAEMGLANRTPGPTGVEDVSRAWSRQISHVISLGHFLRPPENVAIPTARIQCLK